RTGRCSWTSRSASRRPPRSSSTARPRPVRPLLRDWALVVLIALACLTAVIVHDRRSPSKPLLHSATDFTAFYCAGEVVRGGGDPYRVETLRTCERRLDGVRGRPPRSIA